MNFFRQTSMLLITSLRGLGQRRAAAIVTLVSVSTVVAVLVSLLAIREGTAIFSDSAARPDVAIVVGRGALNAFQSVLTRDAVLAIEDAPGIKKTAQGTPYAYAFIIVSVDAIKHDGKRGGVSLVGYTAGSDLVDGAPRIIAGRMYKPAVHELIVSDPIRRMYRGMNVGDRLMLRGTEWTVVGVFGTTNSIGDSILRADAETVMTAFNHPTFQQVNVVVESPTAFERLKAALTANPALAVDVKTAAQNNRENFGQLNLLVEFIAYFIGGVMASGAVFGALNSLYASVDARRREIATLRAIGFNALPVITAVLLESILIALPGAFIGALIAWWRFNGNLTNTQGLIFTLNVTPHLLRIAIFWALAIGLIGGSLPALRAARLPVATAMRAT